MKIPYGLSNFKDVIKGGYTYIDKTAYIAHLEDSGKYQFLLRPRRFGKSLFISMLEYYYDVQCQDEFDTLFGQLHIGRNPTPLKNGYQVLFMEFSGIETSSHEQVLSGFNINVNIYIKAFLKRYGYEAESIAGLADCPAAADQLKHLFNVASDQKILLLIDEYDHFANALLADDLTLFKEVMGKGGFVRSFYEVIKTATQRGTVDRLFVTGVTPLMLDSLTSGFNIGENLSLHPDFNAAMGFTQDETTHVLQALVETCQLEITTLMADVTRWYNGYRFHSQSAETVYNPDMVLYFAKNFDQRNCAYPERMLDDNIASDYRKIMVLFGIGDREANYQVLDEIITTGEVTARQQRKFELDKGFGRDDFVSLLAYMGFVSITGKTIAQTVFGIPNHVIRELYFQYFKVELEHRNQISIPNRPLVQSIETLALQGDLQPLANEMQQALQLLSNRDAIGMDEKHIKILLLTLLYQVPVYFIHSEREMNRKYADILLLERSPYAVNHQHLIELKYSKKADGAKGLENKRQEGITQVQGYLQLPETAALSKLSAWLLLTDGEQVTVLKLN